MTTGNLVGHLNLVYYLNFQSLSIGFPIRAAIVRAAHIEQEGITSARRRVCDR
jgi:hypothetical protein